MSKQFRLAELKLELDHHHHRHYQCHPSPLYHYWQQPDQHPHHHHHHHDHDHRAVWRHGTDGDTFDKRVDTDASPRPLVWWWWSLWKNHRDDRDDDDDADEIGCNARIRVWSWVSQRSLYRPGPVRAKGRPSWTIG